MDDLHALMEHVISELKVTKQYHFGFIKPDGSLQGIADEHATHADYVRKWFEEQGIEPEEWASALVERYCKQTGDVRYYEAGIGTSFYVEVFTKITEAQMKKIMGQGRRGGLFWDIRVGDLNISGARVDPFAEAVMKNDLLKV